MTRSHSINGLSVAFTQQEEDAQDIIDAAYNSSSIARSIASKTTDINIYMDARIKEGIRWGLNTGSTKYDILLTDNMQGFLSRTTLKLIEGRTNPHGGFLVSNGVSFSINDVGIRELALFAGEWGDNISRIRFTQITALEAMNQTQVNAYDPSNIDWSINWALDNQNNGMGWNNDLCLQTP